MKPFRLQLLDSFGNHPRWPARDLLWKALLALAFLKGGAERMGETLRLVSPLTNVETLVEVTSPHFIDPEGDRQRA